MKSLNVLLLSLTVAGIGAGRAQAAIIQTWSGPSSAGVPVSFEAHFAISGDTLTIDLFNNSPVPSANPADTLGSFYFDVVRHGTRPTLTYESAKGDVWTIHAGDTPDTLTKADADLRALVANDDTWQFRTMGASFAPFLGFGIGTVGNSDLSPNNFQGNIVDGRDFSIYHGEVSTNSLNGERMVLDHAQFVFSGVTGFSEADISDVSAFGLGTGPDSIEFTPEPTTLSLILLGVACIRRRR